MQISVIIPTRNAGSGLNDLLSRLNSQRTAPSEIIIIDSASHDNTLAIAKAHGARPIAIRREDFDHGKTRNNAAGEAKGDVLVFMTQDALPENDSLLDHLTSPLERPEIAATYGRHIPQADASLLEIFARRFNYPETALVKGREDITAYGIKTFFFSNVCSAVKRTVFFEAGMFPEGVRTNEDMLFAANLILKGYKISYVPEARVVHSHNLSLPSQFRRYYRIGSALRQHHWIFRHVGAEGEGVRYVKGQISFVLEQRKYHLLPYIFLEFLAKYAGYRIGLATG